MIKKFDGVKFQRERRTKLSKLLSGLPVENMVRYFKPETPHKRKAKTAVRNMRA